MFTCVYAKTKSITITPQFPQRCATEKKWHMLLTNTEVLFIKSDWCTQYHFWSNRNSKSNSQTDNSSNSVDSLLQSSGPNIICWRVWENPALRDRRAIRMIHWNQKLIPLSPVRTSKCTNISKYFSAQISQGILNHFTYMYTYTHKHTHIYASTHRRKWYAECTSVFSLYSAKASIICDLKLWHGGLCSINTRVF